MTSMYFCQNLKIMEIKDTINEVWNDRSLLKQEAPVFANYSNLLSDGQFNLLKAIAKDEAVQNPQASEFLLSHNLGAASTVRSALKSLINKELVIKEANNYLVHDVLFARWLQRL